MDMTLDEAITVEAEARRLKDHFPARRVFVFRLAEGGAPYVTAVPDLRIPRRMLRSGEATECSEITF